MELLGAVMFVAVIYIGGRYWFGRSEGKSKEDDPSKVLAGFLGRMDSLATLYLGKIEITEPTLFYDINTPALEPKQLNPGDYYLVCVPSQTGVDTFWWNVTDTELGISPLELQNLIIHKQARWLKKPGEPEKK
jgi:hypothetical protein